MDYTVKTVKTGNVFIAEVGGFKSEGATEFLAVRNLVKLLAHKVNFGSGKVKITSELYIDGVQFKTILEKGELNDWTLGKSNTSSLIQMALKMHGIVLHPLWRISHQNENRFEK
jgi:deoxyribose-phosphate aldolase